MGAVTNTFAAIPVHCETIRNRFWEEHMMFGIGRARRDSKAFGSAFWDRELEQGLECLNDHDLDRLVAAVTTRTKMTTGWGWHDTNPDGTAKVGCLVGSIMSRDEFDSRTGPTEMESYLERELVQLASDTFLSWVRAYEPHIFYGAHLGLFTPLQPSTMASLTKLVEAEYNRRHPLRIDPAHRGMDESILRRDPEPAVRT